MNDDTMQLRAVEISSLPAEEREKVYADLFPKPVVETKPVTDEDLKTALRTVAQGSPGYVYTAPEWMGDGTAQCFYVHNARDAENVLAPGCMIAYALNALGVPLVALKRWEHRPASEVVAAFFPNASGEIIDAYRRAQSRQDRGQPWGKAIRGLDL